MRYFLEQCLLSIQDACKNLSVETIVIDNNSHDDSCKMVLQKFTDVILIQNKKNIGFGVANNQGVAIAKGEYVLILNPDTVIAEDTLEKILKFAKTKQNLGALGVKLIDGKGNFLPESKRGIPTPRVSFNKLLGISSKQTGKYYATQIKENETGVVDILVGAFMFMKRKIYNEVNGFDEDYFMYGEDIDLSYKIIKKGYQNYYFSDTQIIHYKGESTTKDIKYLRYFYGAMKIFYKKHFKLNVVYDFIMSFGIQFWFIIKWLKLKNKNSPNGKSTNFIFISKNEKFYLKIKKIIKPNLAVYHKQIWVDDIHANKIETIIFDNNTLTNKEIITAMNKLNGKNYSFRLIPKNCNFIIGSDSSINQGNITLIQT